MYLESIKLLNHKFQNLAQHQERVNRTLYDQLKISKPFSLKKELLLPKQLKASLYKCRVLYTYRVTRIEYHPYHRKTIRTLQLIEANELEYDYKFANREALAKLMDQKRKETDDILIVKNGRITDSSYSNVVFFDGAKWYTPDQPLLAGTKRAQLLKQGKIVERKISPKDLNQFIGVKLINAMIDLEDGNLIVMDQVF